MTHLNAAEMIAAAESATGLGDWGDDDFRGPFEVLAQAILEEADLTPKGLALSHSWLMSRLCQRLKLFEDRKRYPEITCQKIERPLFVTGLPRAGTTYTHSLLGSSPSHVAPMLWQWYTASPPPNDPRIDHAPAIHDIERFIVAQGWTRPEIMATHEHSSQSPEECSFGFELSFINLNFTGYWNIPSYYKVTAGDYGPAYRIHRKLLQAMQVGAEGRRWILKAPEHLTHLKPLFNEYPDALIVQNHRDPAKIIASVLKVIASLQSLYSDRVLRIDRAYALNFISMYAAGLERVTEMRRDPAINAKFTDVHYLDLERDPLGVMRKIYDRSGMPFADASSKAMSRWILENRKGKHGKHRYRLDDYGISADEVRQAFAKYIDQTAIEIEPET